MKFKILKGTDAFKQLMVLSDRMLLCNQMAKEYAIKLGAKEWVFDNSPYIIAGGLSGMRFPVPPGKNYRRAFPRHFTDVYIPSEKVSVMKNVVEDIKNLPRIDTRELNSILNFTEQDIENGRNDDTMTHLFSPVVSFFDDYILISVNEKCKYSPVPDAIEITFSEYQQLRVKTEAQPVA